MSDHDSAPDMGLPADMSRRAMLGRMPLAALATTAIVPASAAALGAAMQINPNANLVALCAALEKVHRSYMSTGWDSDTAFEPVHELHWSLRERINALPATTLPGFQAKARAVELAFEADPAAECDSNGSFVYLARSLAADLLSGGHDV